MRPSQLKELLSAVLALVSRQGTTRTYSGGGRSLGGRGGNDCPKEKTTFVTRYGPRGLQEVLGREENGVS